MDRNSFTEKEEFVFDAEIYNEKINISDIAALESFYKKHNYLPNNYINLFLNYIVYYARYNITPPLENYWNSSFKAKCSTAASISDELLTKMNFKTFEFNVGNVFGDTQIHQLCIVYIPTMVDGKIINKSFILDPTFRQFCIKEENRFERYFEEKRYAVKMASPHPGYFLKLYDKGTTFANNLIKYGYFEVNNDNIKTYFDSFYFYLKKMESYEDQNKVGKEYISPIKGEDYLKEIFKHPTDWKIPSGLKIKTPLEMVEEEQKKLKNRLKYFFLHQDQFTSDLDLEEKNSNLKI